MNGLEMRLQIGGVGVDASLPSLSTPGNFTSKYTQANH